MLSSWSRRCLVIVAGAVGLAGCGVGALLGEEAFGSDGRFVLAFERAREEPLQAVGRELEAAGDLEAAVELLNKKVDSLVKVKVVVRSCDDGTLYDPSRREIQICLEDVVQTRELLTDNPKSERALTERGIIVDTVNHEAAHALLHVHNMSFTGREEDVADQFSAYMSMRRGSAGLDDLESTAYGYELSADAFEHDVSDEHASDAQRAVNYQCYVYGAKKRDSAHLIAKNGLTKQRAEFCSEEWEDLRDGWHRLLGDAGALR